MKRTASYLDHLQDFDRLQSFSPAGMPPAVIDVALTNRNKLEQVQARFVEARREILIKYALTNEQGQFVDEEGDTIGQGESPVYEDEGGEKKANEEVQELMEREVTVDGLVTCTYADLAKVDVPLGSIPLPQWTFRSNGHAE